MAKYNVALNGSITTPTISGGTVSFTPSELEAITDGITDTGGITISGSESVFIDTNLSNRTYLDSFRVYITSTESRETVLSNLQFYYRDYITDEFIQLGKADNSTYYYANGIPSLFAPLECRVTVSGACTINELILYSDDQYVSFGENGTETTHLMSDVPIGRLTRTETLNVFNNDVGSISSTAYISVDYTGNEHDKYLSLSSDGINFFKYTDGLSITSDTLDSNYRWSLGSFNNTEVSGNNVVLKDGYNTGTYTTPIFQFNNEHSFSKIMLFNKLTASGVSNIPSYLDIFVDQYNPSYVIVEETTVSGTSITKDLNSYEGTIEVRSSNIDPVDIIEMYMINMKTGIVGTTVKVDKYDVNYDEEYNSYIYDSLLDGYSTRQHSMAINQRNGDIYVMFNKYYYTSIYDHIKKYNREGSLLSTAPTNISIVRNGVLKSEIDNVGGLWLYTKYYKYLERINSDLSIKTTYIGYDSEDWVNDFSAEKNGTSVWVASVYKAALLKIDYQGNILIEIALAKPITVCTTLDDGAWVYEEDSNTFKRYDSEGNHIKDLVGITPYDYKITKITCDLQASDGIWAINDMSIYHIGSDGDIIGAIDLPNGSSLQGISKGVVINSILEKKCYFVNLNCELLRIWDVTDDQSTTFSLSCGFSFEASDVSMFNSTKMIPFDGDEIWGGSGTLEWKEIKKNGYFLPKSKYHQFRLTLNRDSVEDSPIVNSIRIPYSIKIEDVYPQESKPFYLKAEFDPSDSLGVYNSKLKCWWFK